jgi:predicted nucleic acid-binding protein
MAGYYDSSLILAIVLGQGDRDALLRIWDDEDNRMSSVLLRPECVVSIRRLAGMNAGTPADRRRARVEENLTVLEPYLRRLTYKALDDSVADLVRQDQRLAECRTLDAVHIATALWFQPHLDDPLRICSLDLRLRALARRLALPVRPESVEGEK